MRSRGAEGRLTGVVLLFTITACSVFAAPSSGVEQQIEIPSGYVFHETKEFTDSPRAPPKVDPRHAQGPVPPPEDGHNVLLAPNGSTYLKPVSDSLAELKKAGGAQAVFSKAATDQHFAISPRGRGLQEIIEPIPSEEQACLNYASDDKESTCKANNGTDIRTQVLDTQTHPYWSVGRLVRKYAKGNMIGGCTGTLIGRRHVLTAAHCVYDLNHTHGIISALDFVPAMDGLNCPYDTLEWKYARIMSQFWNEKTYNTTAVNYDFALVTLAEAAKVDHLDLFLPSAGSQTVTNVSLTTAGYPCSEEANTMWSSDCGLVNINDSANHAWARGDVCHDKSCANILRHACVSEEGQSGSSIWDADYRIRAILTGQVNLDNGNYSLATRIDTEVLNQLASWYREDLNVFQEETTPTSDYRSSLRLSISAAISWLPRFSEAARRIGNTSDIVAIS